MRQLLIMGCILLLSLPSYALQIGGITLSDKIQFENNELLLNGAGTRSKWFFDLYVGTLYLQKNSEDAAAIIQADELMAIRLDITSSMITSEKMRNATLEGFEKSTKGDMFAIKPQVDRFLSAFNEEIIEGDVFEFIHQPRMGVIIKKNGIIKETIESLAFKKALFGIWLSEDPAQKSLKESMLGL